MKTWERRRLACQGGRDGRVPIFKGESYGHPLSLSDPALFRGHLWADLALRPANGGHKMTVLYAIVGILALGLLVYLVAALLKPEWFG
jgi:K+-transporting ATPase KdpF subunit